MSFVMYFPLSIFIVGLLLQLFEPRDIFAGEKIVGDPFVPKKQFEDHQGPFEKWLHGESTSEERRRKRQQWMNLHYNSETHPIDL